MLQSVSRRRSAFTLAELIIVMMIIVLLVAILLPALSSARAKAKKVASQAQMTAIAAAIESYKIALNATPGYIKDAGTTSALEVNTVRSGYSSTENLVVSLLGRMSATNVSGSYQVPGVSPSVYVDINGVGSGPISSSGATYGSFYSPKPDELVALQNTQYGGDNNVPELVDSFGMAILYFRGQTSGVTKLVSTNSSRGGKFLLYTNADYIWSSAIETADGDQKNQQGDSLICDAGGAAGSNTTAENNFAWAVANRGLGTTSGTASSANDGNDVARDFVLVSAGEDGVYFSKGANGGSTTISSFDDIDSFDDLVY